MGVAFQGVDASEAELIGHLVPLVVVRHFLDGLHKGDSFNRVPGLGIDVSPLQNDHLRAYSGIDAVSVETVKDLLREAKGGEEEGEGAVDAAEPEGRATTERRKGGVVRARRPRGTSASAPAGRKLVRSKTPSSSSARPRTKERVILGTDLPSPAEDEDGVSGCRVTRVWGENTCAGHLQRGDLLIGVCGHAIANDGSVVYRGGCRADAEVWVHERHVLDTIVLTIVRDGTPRNVTVTLLPLAHLVPRAPYYDTPPRFFVYGGLVLQPVSLGLLESLEVLGSADAVVAITQGVIDDTRSEVVMLTQVLADDVNLGYEEETDALVRAVNGQPIRGLSHALQLIEQTPRGSLVTLTLSTESLIALPSPLALAADTARINALYNVTKDRRVDEEEEGVISPRARVSVGDGEEAGAGGVGGSVVQWLKVQVARVQAE
jgi:hypothetical protein